MIISRVDINTFAMAKHRLKKELQFEGFSDVKAGIVKWPMSVIRISGPDKERLIELADKILLTWRGYTDEDAFIYAETDGEPHNTITPIARRRGDDFELDLVLRNNITTGSILWVFIIHMQNCIISKKRTSVSSRLWDLRYCLPA